MIEGSRKSYQDSQLLFDLHSVLQAVQAWFLWRDACMQVVPLSSNLAQRPSSCSDESPSPSSASQKQPCSLGLGLPATSDHAKVTFIATAFGRLGSRTQKAQIPYLLLRSLGLKASIPGFWDPIPS